MQKHHLPISIFVSPSLRKILKQDADLVAGKALNAILRDNRSLEIAHQQFRWKSTPVVFSSRVTLSGYLIIDMDIGDERLANRIVLEKDFRQKPAERRHG